MPRTHVQGLPSVGSIALLQRHSYGDDNPNSETMSSRTPHENHEIRHNVATPTNAGGPPTLYRDDPLEHERLLTKVSRRLLPFLWLLYLFSFLDRSNLSNVHKRIIKDINITEEQYGIAASIFFVPYVILEIPSNMILQRVDARRWLARIIFTWGLVSSLMVFVDGFGLLCFLRFLLGVAVSMFEIA